MKKIAIGIIAMIIAGCTNLTTREGNNTEKVVYDPSGSSGLLTSGLIEEITIVPLETGREYMVAGIHELRISNGDYYIMNRNGSRNILRFDSKGNFMNSIGQAGSGPQEYFGISDFDIDGNDNVLIFSYENKKAFKYSSEGKFIETVDFGRHFSRAATDSDGFWLYLGYGNMDGPVRLVRTNDKGELAGQYLEDDYKILAMEESTPVFSKYGNTTFLRESMNRMVYRITGDEINAAYEFDFGNYAIPDEYYKKPDAMEAAMYLFSRDFAVIRKFMENKRYVVMEGQIQKIQNGRQSQVTMVYGIKNKKENKWSWFNIDQGFEPADIINRTIQYLSDDDELICIVDADVLINHGDKTLFTNPDTINSLQDDQNSVILRCKLK